MRVNPGRKLQFHSKITITSLNPDIVMWSTGVKTVLLIELTVPWEKGVEAPFQRKRLKDLGEEANKEQLLVLGDKKGGVFW